MPRFAIARTSIIWSEPELPPCPEAVRLPYLRTENTWPPNVAGWTERWHAKGYNHRQNEYGRFLREVDEEGWFIDLEWSDLSDFIQRHGDIVIEKEWGENPAYMLLEIYDGSRE